MTRRPAQPVLCQARHRHEPDRPRAAADGLNLCPGCRIALGRHIRDLPELHADVLAQLPTGRDTAAPPVTGSRTPPLPYNTRAGDWLAQTRHDLRSITSLVSVERGIAGPPPNPGAQCAWLERHADWLAAHPNAGAFKDMFAEQVGRAYSIIDPARLPLVLPVRCIEPVDDEPCGGILRATVRRDDDPTPSVIWCDGCDLELDTTQWHRYGRRLQRGRMAG
ncbi:hypothetical protein ACNF49_14040 [Actinomadura sp. ATCC 39365]